MVNFKILLSPNAVKDLDYFSDQVCRKLTIAMKTLEENPFPKGKLIRKIKGKNSDYYRLRVDKYRAFYIIESGKVVILRILSKKDTSRFISNLN